jgi:hypothetical protein
MIGSWLPASSWQGRVDFVAYCQQHEPEVIILDIAPPCLSFLTA